MDALAIVSGGVYVDATVGGGGHFRVLADKLDNTGTAVGIDRDSDAIAWCKAHMTSAEPAIILEQAPFSNLGNVLDKHNITGINGLLLDLGVSSHQIDEAERGFSYMQTAQLDMRMDRSGGMSALDILCSYGDTDLARILSDFGEVTNPVRMAKAIVAFREKFPLETSADLVKCLKREYGENLQIKVLAKVFQALRIAVNNELSELSTCLEKAVSYLKPGGRLAVISYHSLEDRIVKNFMRSAEHPCQCPQSLPYCICNKKPVIARVNHKVIVPTAVEINNNTRARSARLRVAEKLNIAGV